MRIASAANNHTSFWIDGNGSKCRDDIVQTSQMTISANGTVISSYCDNV